MRRKWQLALLFGLAGGLVGCDRDRGRTDAREEPPGLPERTAQAGPQQARAAQAGEPIQQQPGAPEGDRTVVSDGDIEKFVATQLEMAELQSKVQAEVREGKDPDVAQVQYQRQAGKALEASGLSIERYQAIANRVTEDPQLREKVQRQVTAALDKE